MIKFEPIEPLGYFQEREVGNWFTFSARQEGDWSDLPHRIWVNDTIGNPYRMGKVLRTVAYIAVDEDAEGNPVLEKWELKKHYHPTVAEMFAG